MSMQSGQRWLQPGQPQWMWMERDAHLLVQRGVVAMVLPHAWWADAADRTAITVSAGSARGLRRGGWVQLEALGGRSAEVLSIAPATQPDRGLGAWWASASAALFGPRARRLHHLGPLARLGGNEAGERC
ncbi:hypothetical protein ACVNIS_05995 [Sphaerotilaceae bacterium SBD11-9]